MGHLPVSLNSILALILVGLVTFSYRDSLVQLLPLAAPIPTPAPSPIPATEQPQSPATLQLPDRDPLPLVTATSFTEADIQALLQQGAVILPLEAKFGETGNSVITAHSSGPAWFGQYRSAFKDLQALPVGGTFTIMSGSTSHTYRVFEREVVKPTAINEISFANRSTVTLVTCWPLWTDWRRLLVHGELISPQPVSH